MTKGGDTPGPGQYDNKNRPKTAGGTIGNRYKSHDYA